MARFLEHEIEFAVAKFRADGEGEPDAFGDACGILPTIDRVMDVNSSRAPLMKLVEVVRTILTSDDAFDRAFAFAKKLGKDPVACRDNSGFIVNRLLVPYILDAIRAFEEGVGSIEDIDKAMMLGCGYPMGPFTLLDFVGLDTTYYITHVMFDEYREKRFAAPALLRKMVLAGRYGRKTGAGFYDYSGEKPVPFDRA